MLDQSYVRHEGQLTQLGFGPMAAALPHMMGVWRAALPGPRGIQPSNHKTAS
ncbi:hypothetical protein [Streptomyces exfoliatus]|uniref:hypothetical protein n=1 Tax=Streptomyces exfoliatus TaxID=1905 RepID=UPI003C2E0018